MCSSGKSGRKRRNFKNLLWLLWTLNSLPAKAFRDVFPEDSSPPGNSFSLGGQKSFGEKCIVNYSLACVFFCSFVCLFLSSVLPSPFFLFPSFPTSVLSTFSSGFHGSIYSLKSGKSKWLTKKPPFLFSLQMRWVGKGDKHHGPDDLNIDAPWANRRERAAGTCLVISFVIHADIVRTIPCRSLENLSFVRCKATDRPCFQAQLLLQQSRVAASNSGPTYLWISLTFANTSASSPASSSPSVGTPVKSCI